MMARIKQFYYNHQEAIIVGTALSVALLVAIAAGGD